MSSSRRAGTTPPGEIAEIMGVVRSFCTALPETRPGFERPVISIEVESKLPISSTDQVETVLQAVEQLGPISADFRSEYQTIYMLADGGHLARIEVAGQDELWLKTKSRNNPALTPRYGLPVVTRQGHKFNKHDAEYADYLALTESSQRVAEFWKENANIFFAHGGHIYSLSFSLAWNEDGFLHREMEFEYEGSVAGKAITSLVGVEECLESVLVDLLPPALRSTLRSQTKFEVLLGDALKG